MTSKGRGYENPDWRPNREEYEHTASVYEHAADVMTYDPKFQQTLREWAADKRRKAAALTMEPVQIDMFGETS